MYQLVNNPATGVAAWPLALKLPGVAGMVTVNFGAAVSPSFFFSADVTSLRRARVRTSFSRRSASCK